MVACTDILMDYIQITSTNAQEKITTDCINAEGISIGIYMPTVDCLTS